MKLVWIHGFVSLLFGFLSGYFIGLQYFGQAVLSFMISIVFLMMSIVLYGLEKEKERF